MILCTAAAPPAARPRPGAPIAVPGGYLHVGQHGIRTIISVSIGGTRHRLVLPKEDGIYAGAESITTLIGAVPGRVLILRSDYASNPSGGAFRCGAGTETVLRLLALQPALRLTFDQRIGSCWEDIDQGDLGWDARTRTLTVERTTIVSDKPNPRAEDLRLHYHVGLDGSVTAGQVDHLSP